MKENKKIKMDKKTAIEITGGLSVPSKMPCYSYNIPAENCNVGSKLVHVNGSVCSRCYALKGRYPLPNVQNAMKKRFNSLSNPKWVESMVFLINSTKIPWFRWHDSGDIQDEKHLARICEVAKKTPKVKHWIPTREYYIVSEYIRKGNKIPKNLEIRLSSFMIEGKAPTEFAKRLGLTTSGVSKDSFDCPAHNQGNKCCSCRACWDNNIPNVTYRLHMETKFSTVKCNSCGYKNSIKATEDCLYCGASMVTTSSEKTTETTDGINSLEHALNHVSKYRKRKNQAIKYKGATIYNDNDTDDVILELSPRDLKTMYSMYLPLRRWELIALYMFDCTYNTYIRFRLK